MLSSEKDIIVKNEQDIPAPHKVHMKNKEKKGGRKSLFSLYSLDSVRRGF